jgi:hypothetical protein|eukprot:jgi/Chrpa1/13261/Chrysochromulina_OHIO_Genome00000521-RA
MASTQARLAPSHGASSSTAAATALLLSALKKDNPDCAEYPDIFLEATAAMLAEVLEAAPNMAKRVRSLAYNLTRNQSLRRELLSGAMLPAALCAMDTLDWASTQVKREREAEAAERSKAVLRLATTGGRMWSYTRSVCCPECGGARARFRHIGTDMKEWHGSKNEVWGNKHSDNDRGDCEIVCESCDHTWHSSAPDIAEGGGDESRDEPDIAEGGGDESRDEFEEPRRRDGRDLGRILGGRSP